MDSSVEGAGTQAESGEGGEVVGSEWGEEKVGGGKDGERGVEDGAGEGEGEEGGG